jgi:hypothetical protein
MLGLSLALAACDGASTLLSDASAPASETGGCNSEVTSDWAATESLRFKVEAQTMGETCEHAVAVMVVRAQDGAPLFSVAQPAAHTFGLSGAKTASEMRLALRDWVRQDGIPRTGKELPEWPAGAESPGAGQEFPFMAETWLDQSTYEAIRAEDAPIFTYPQGMESQAVLVLKDGQLERIGIQTFPG